jgi:streptogramin lyase
MLRERSSRVDPVRAGNEGRRRTERVPRCSSRHRRHRPGVECLEDRRLLSAITAFPLPSNGSPSDLTIGPDGNLWLTEVSFGRGGVPHGSAVVRITPSGSLTEFPLPAFSAAGALTAGPDGNLWFTDSSEIGRITPAGALTEFPLPAGQGTTSGLTVGPDGNLWFPESSINSAVPGAIGRITPTGSIAEFSLPTAGMNPGALTVGPDGNLWFPESSSLFGGSGAIGRISPAGAVTDYPLPTSVYASSLTVGPDGNFWFSELGPLGPFGPGGIGRITPTGAITEFPLSSGGSPFSLTVGRDGNFWFVESGPGITRSYSIGRITPAGALTDDFQFLAVRAEMAYPTSDLTAGPDGNLWISEKPYFGPPPGPAIVRITLAGAITQFPLPASSNGASALTAGPDGNLWFTEQLSDGSYKIGKVRVAPGVTKFAAVADSRGAITSILVSFDKGMQPASAAKAVYYAIASGVERGQTIVYSKRVKIARVSYDRATHAVRLKLAVPQKGSVQVTVRAGLVAADGMSSSNDFTAVVI